nr:MAG TPA: hypothetical protein [Caudoviricetes sp.]
MATLFFYRTWRTSAQPTTQTKPVKTPASMA